MLISWLLAPLMLTLTLSVNVHDGVVDPVMTGWLMEPNVAEPCPVLATYVGGQVMVVGACVSAPVMTPFGPVGPNAVPQTLIFRTDATLHGTWTGWGTTGTLQPTGRGN